MELSVGAEGTACTFTGNFRRARILKRFSYETGVTLETISVNQVGWLRVKLMAVVTVFKIPGWGLELLQAWHTKKAEK